MGGRTKLGTIIGNLEKKSKGRAASSSGRGKGGKGSASAAGNGKQPEEEGGKNLKISRVIKTRHKAFRKEKESRLGFVVTKENWNAKGTLGVKGFDGKLYSFKQDTQEDDGKFRTLVTVIFQVSGEKSSIPKCNEEAVRGSWIQEMSSDLLDKISKVVAQRREQRDAANGRQSVYWRLKVQGAIGYAEIRYFRGMADIKELEEGAVYHISSYAHQDNSGERYARIDSIEADYEDEETRLVGTVFPGLEGVLKASDLSIGLVLGTNEGTSLFPGFRAVRETELGESDKIARMMQLIEREDTTEVEEGSLRASG